MRSESRFPVGVAAAFAAFLVVKMVLLEPVTWTGVGLQLTLAAALLPLALLLGWPGVGVIAGACALAHGVNDGDLADALVAGGAVAVATAGAHSVVRAWSSPLGWVAAGWVLTGLLAAAMGAGYALLAYGFVEVFLTVLAGTWLAVNLVGVPGALALRRAGLAPGGGGRGWAEGTR